ncbi:MAG TPA: UvrB/UvrC motif-containing protein [Patescibacteria group bacterium]|nr:UvrB/UvrC motif-containing protein [Patescibacteria group bacterium]
MVDFKEKIKKFPDSSGIYLFYSASHELIYVGKATSLRDRVKSYFQKRLKTTRPIEEMIHEVGDIKCRQTDSVLEAVILESLYIKKYQPIYNVQGKDDKSWNYISIFRDPYPMVATIREHDLKVLRVEGGVAYRQIKYLFGPYPHLNSRATLKTLRQIFLFSTCQPNQKRPCLYYEMKQCLGVCTGEISPEDYRKEVIRPLIMFLRGKKKGLVRVWEKEMEKASHEERFEEAARLRNQLRSLRHVQDMAMINESFVGDESENSSVNRYSRIEGYDISNLGITDKVGSLVVFRNGRPDKSFYRKFNIKTVVGQSDVDCLAEVLERRLKREDWGTPDLILIDGGKPQVNKAKDVLEGRNLTLPVVGIAKGPERKRNDFFLVPFNENPTEFSAWVKHNKNLLIAVRDEAHRFAIAFNRSKRKIRL